MPTDILNISTLHDLLDHDARKFSSGEAQLKSILPKWIDVAGSVALKGALQAYLAQAKLNAKSLQEFIQHENIGAQVRLNKVMQSLIKEIREKLSNCTNDKVRDACLLASIQAINHYKISQYGTAAAFAKAIGSLHYADVFHEAELKEVFIDSQLTAIAEKEINREAMAPLSLSAS